MNGTKNQKQSCSPNISYSKLDESDFPALNLDEKNLLDRPTSYFDLQTSNLNSPNNSSKKNTTKRKPVKLYNDPRKKSAKIEASHNLTAIDYSIPKRTSMRVGFASNSGNDLSMQSGDFPYKIHNSKSSSTVKFNENNSQIDYNQNSKKYLLPNSHRRKFEKFYIQRSNVKKEENLKHNRIS